MHSRLLYSIWIRFIRQTYLHVIYFLQDLSPPKKSGSSSYPSTTLLQNHHVSIYLSNQTRRNETVSGPLLAKAHRRWRSSNLATWKLLDTSGKKGQKGDEPPNLQIHFIMIFLGNERNSIVEFEILVLGRLSLMFLDVIQEPFEKQNVITKMKVPGQTSKHPNIQHSIWPIFPHFLLTHLVLAVARDFNQSWCTTIICKAKSSPLGNMISWKIPIFNGKRCIFMKMVSFPASQVRDEIIPPNVFIIFDHVYTTSNAKREKLQ